MKNAELSSEFAGAVARLPAQLLTRSGSVFYSGRSAFSGIRPLYILGLNPGGSPLRQAGETIAQHLDAWRHLPADWSAYVDEAWLAKAPGMHGMQPRMQHMFRKLRLDLRQVPASNVVFARSENEAKLATQLGSLLPQCWPVHEAVIDALGVRTVLCLGGTAGRWVRDRLNAHRVFDCFVERNERRWRSVAHLAPDGRAVVTVTHPGRADWTNPAADPTLLVQAMLERSR